MVTRRQLMRFIRFILITLLSVGIGVVAISEYGLLDDSAPRKWHPSAKLENQIKNKEVPQTRMLSETFKGDLYQWIGKTSKEVLNQMGEPKRKDLSAYGYTWWVYTNNTQHIQLGISDGKVVTIFAAGNNLGAEPLKIGQGYETLKDHLSFEDTVNYRSGVSTYQFELTDEDVTMRPLVKMTDDVFAQLYFDTFDKRLMSLRILDGETLLKHSPYQMVYRGNIGNPKQISPETWDKIEKGMEQQIFEITNMMRKNYKRNALEWEEAAGEVAFLHSKDMEENDYFSHYDLNGGGLKERLTERNIAYLSAGENIAAKYSDAPAVIAGWLNSEGHREALLNDSYTHLGVGVYRFHYTQNFLEKIQ